MLRPTSREKCRVSILLLYVMDKDLDMTRTKITKTQTRLVNESYYQKSSLYVFVQLLKC